LPPRTPRHFGDGGAFAEHHALQYPLGMGANGVAAASQLGRRALLTPQGRSVTPEHETAVRFLTRFGGDPMAAFLGAEHVLCCTDATPGESDPHFARDSLLETNFHSFPLQS
jgi:hypothetical protein